MSEKKELTKIRKEIDELDKQLLTLLNSRLVLAQQAGKAKKDEIIYRQGTLCS